jgi:hypothetical protein
MATISGSVGKGGKNLEADVRYIQELLGLNLGIALTPPIVNGVADTKLSDLIVQFQKELMGSKKPDGRIDPGGGSLARLMAFTLPTPSSAPPEITESDLQTAATTLSAELASVKAVSQVESRGDGFLASGRPKILFERHIFSGSSYGTSHAYDGAHSDISNTSSGGYGADGEHQYDRLYKAMACDRIAAMKSASWGRFQVMGFNFSVAGFASVEDFVTKMYESEGQHLIAFTNYVKNTAGLQKALQDKDWTTFAQKYNGPDYKNAVPKPYDEMLEDAYKSFSPPATPAAP